jgi:hypothetical protein
MSRFGETFNFSAARESIKKPQRISTRRAQFIEGKRAGAVHEMIQQTHTLALSSRSLCVGLYIFQLKKWRVAGKSNGPGARNNGDGGPDTHSLNSTSTLYTDEREREERREREKQNDDTQNTHVHLNIAPPLAHYVACLRFFSARKRERERETPSEKYLITPKAFSRRS